MRTRFMAAVLFVALGAIAASASAGIVLRYKMAKGETLTYQCGLDGNGAINAMTQSGPVQMAAEFTYTMQCQAVDAAGNLTILHTIREPKVNAVWNGEKLPVNLAVPAVTTVIAPSGTIISTLVHRAQSQAPDAMSLAGSLGAGLTQGAQLDVGRFYGDLKGPGFPEQEVKPGDRWQQVLNLTTQAGQPMPCTHPLSSMSPNMAATDEVAHG